MNTIEFYCQSSPDQKIHVADESSAAQLQMLLNQSGSSEWLRKEHGHSVAAVAPSAPVHHQVEQHIGPDRRQAERVAKELRVVLLAGSSTFRCGTCDVSKGGVRLKASVPEAFCATNCKAYISQQGDRENLEIECKVIKDENGVSRLQFVHASSEEIAVLSNWMAG
jgi:hypothetical protein